MASPRRRAARIVKRRANIALLSDALFGPRHVAYARRRLLFPGLRMGLMAFFHALEAVALLLIFDPIFLLPIISVRLVSSFLGSVIWGATETLRQDVRYLLAQRKRLEASQRIEEALLRASLLAIVIVIGSIVWAWRHPYLAPGVYSVIDAYLLALALRIALSWISRTYHSGLQATRRVYRPRWSLILPDILDGLGLFIFWRLVGPWSVALAVVSSTVLHVSLSFYYSRRAYRDADIPLPHLFRLRRWKLPNSSLVKRWFLSVAIGLSCELPSVFVLGQWHSLAGGADVSAAMFLYWSRPFASFLSSIARIYYVDIVRAEELGTLGSTRVRRNISWIILVLGTLLTFTICVLVSIFASMQGALVVGIYLAAATLLAIITLRALIYMIHGYAPVAPQPHLPLLRFLDCAVGSRSPCMALLFHLEAKEPTRIVGGLLLALERLEGGQAVRLGRRYLLCISTEEHARAEWLTAVGGTAQLVATSAWCSDGHSALSSLWSSSQFPGALKSLLAGPTCSDELETLIRESAPGTQVLTARDGIRSDSRTGSFAELRRAISQYQGPFPPARSSWGAAGSPLVLVVEGNPVWLALLPPETPSLKVAALRRLTWGLGVRIAWFGVHDLRGREDQTNLAAEGGMLSHVDT